MTFSVLSEWPKKMETPTLKLGTLTVIAQQLQDIGKIVLPWHFDEILTLAVGDIWIDCSTYLTFFTVNYNQGLIDHVRCGTPKRPRAIEAYIFAMFNENQRGGDATERNFGLLYPDKQAVYLIRFN
jgi:hypothetical protein